MSPIEAKKHRIECPYCGRLSLKAQDVAYKAHHEGFIEGYQIMADYCKKYRSFLDRLGINYNPKDEEE